MRPLAVFALLLTLPAAAQSPGGVGGDQRPCEFQGHRLMGRVRVVDAFPDFNVKVEDDERKGELHVRRVEQPAELCGEWQFVDGMADFTIRFVDSGEDFTITWVKEKPGIPDDPVQR
jgi:hypothetical protein